MLAPNASDIDREAQRALRPHLQPDETLLWTARPPGWRLAIWELPKLAVMVVLIVCVLTSFGITKPIDWLAGLFGYNLFHVNDDPGPFLLLAGLFLLVGFYGLAASMAGFVNGWFTYYGLTGKRVIIVQKIPPGGITSFWPNGLSTMSRSGSSDRGTISLSPRDNDTRRNIYTTPRKLIGISNPARVEGLIASTLLARRTEGRYS